MLTQRGGYHVFKSPDNGGCRHVWGGVAPKVGYMNENDGATPLCNVGTFSGACSNCRRSLMIYLRTRRGMPLTEWLEGVGASSLIQSPRSSLRVVDQEAESNWRITRRPLLHHYHPARWAPCPYSVLPRVQGGCSLVHFHPDPLPNKPASARSLTVDGQHSSAI